MNEIYSPLQKKARKKRSLADRQAMRAALIQSLRAEGDDDLADVLKKCATPLPLVCTSCGSRKTVETGCKKRWCPVCAHVLAGEKVAKYQLALKRMKWPLFVTLTVRSSEYAEESVRALIEAFFGFRRTKWWKACEIAGGIRGVEITHAAGGWHPHLHLLMDCEWLAVEAPKPGRGCAKQKFAILKKQAQRELAKEWAKYLGQETSMVYVKRANKRTLHEVVKYSIDPEDLVEADGWAGEAIRCMRGTRATQTWGNCHGLAAEFRKLENESAPRCTCPGCTRPSWLPSVLVDGSVADQIERARENAYFVPHGREYKLGDSYAQRRKADSQRLDKYLRALHGFTPWE